jgi:hypothetical protein
MRWSAQLAALDGILEAAPRASAQAAA